MPHIWEEEWKEYNKYIKNKNRYYMNLNKLKQSVKYSQIISLYQQNWFKISRHKYLPASFIDAYFFKLKSYNIQYYQKLTPYLMFKYGQNLNWQVMSKTQDIPEFLLRKYVNKINWYYISQYQNLSNQFIIQFWQKLNHQKLRYNRYLKDNISLISVLNREENN